MTHPSQNNKCITEVLDKGNSELKGLNPKQTINVVYI
jgi:hypothetical protein